jgi:hypothetical protein
MGEKRNAYRILAINAERKYIGKYFFDVGKYSFVYRSIKDWNSLPAGILESFSCKLNTFRSSYT